MNVKRKVKALEKRVRFNNRGDLEGQALAWRVVHSFLLDIGMDKWERSDMTGMEEAVAFIDHIRANGGRP